MRAGQPLSPSEVTFYYFAEREPAPRRLAIVEVLESFDVRCVAIDRAKGGYAGAWDQLLRRWQETLGAAPPAAPAAGETTSPALVAAPPADR